MELKKKLDCNTVFTEQYIQYAFSMGTLEASEIVIQNRYERDKT